MDIPQANNSVTPFPDSVAVIGAAGGLGKGILRVCRDEGIRFTAIVRSRPERIGDVPDGSRVEIISSLADVAALTSAFEDSKAVLTATGVTPTSRDESALLSRNLPALKLAMEKADVRRIVMMNTLLSRPPGVSPSTLMRLFSWFPGTIGRGATELQAVVDGIYREELSSLDWTLVRGAVNGSGVDEPPVASLDWSVGTNSWQPVSYVEMGRWMLQEATACNFIHTSPLVSRPKYQTN